MRGVARRRDGARYDASVHDDTDTSIDVDYWVRQDPRPLERVLRQLTSPIWRYLYRCEAVGAEHVPAEGGFVLAPNHSSYLDPFLHVYGQRRVVRFMAKSTLFDVPILRTIVRVGGGFPVRRGAGDAGAIDVARAILRDGQVVVVYPEGTRYRTALELGPPRTGAARLALEAGVPVVPVAAWGAKQRRLYGLGSLRRRVTVVYGEPMRFDDLAPTREDAAVARDRIWREVSRLYDRAREHDAERAAHARRS